jgi:glycosyltransferase involved in cell wall biosynthesis
MNDLTKICGKYLRYPDTSGKRIVEGGLRLQGTYKNSLPGKPLVTVITTVFNCEKHIEQAILSVLKQTYDNIEYIVVDAASKDNTLDIINKYKNSLDYYISEPDSGIYAGMNKGISLAAGDYIITLNADDYYTKNAIEKLVQRAVEVKTDLVAAHSCNIDENNHQTKNTLCRSTWTDFAYLICPLKHETMLATKEVYNKIGYYNEEMKICADWFWMAQAYRSNCSASIVNEELLIFQKIGTTSKPLLQEHHIQERLSAYALLFEGICDKDLEKLKKISSITPTIKTELIKNNPKCTLLHKALEASSVWAYASGMENNTNSFYGQYLYYPNKTGIKRLASGGLRLEHKKFKRSLPDKPLVTVVTTVCNCVKYIEQAILSVLEQTYENIEYIIIDAASKDGTLDIIKKYRKSLAYYISEPDNGIYAGMNKGISLANGDYIIILNADDYYKKDAIEKLVQEAIKSGADIIAAHASTMDEKGDVISEIKSRWTAEVYISSPLRHETMLISKDTYNDVGYYDESRKVISDRIWMRSAYEQGKTASIIDESILMFRQIGVSSIQSERHDREALDALREIAPSITESDLNKIRSIWKLRDREIKDLATRYSSEIKLHKALSAAITSRENLIGTILPDISVQVPVYNAEKYLAECLDSILQQTFTNFEVICIDDGSTDNSVAILNRYAKKDSRILVFQHETNKGTLQARKTAFEKAQGKYMVFVDADDIAKPEMFEQLHTKASLKYIDLVQCGATIYDPKNKLKKPVYERYHQFFTNVKEYSATGQRNVFGAFGIKIKNNFWISIVRKKVYKQIIPYIPNSVIPHGNDNLVMLMLIYFSHTYASLDKILYIYRASSTSSNLTSLSVEKAKNHIRSRSDVLFYAKEFMKKVNPKFDEKTEPFSRFTKGLVTYTTTLIERCIETHPYARTELLQFFTQHFPEHVFNENQNKAIAKPRTNTSSSQGINPNQPGLSIIVVFQNGPEHLNRLLLTFIKNNTYTPVEFIIIAHESENNITEVVSKYITKAFIQLITLNKNYTSSAARNLGAKNSNYSNLLFLSSKILYTSDIIPAAITKLDDPSIGAVGVRLDENYNYVPFDRDPSVQHSGVTFEWEGVKQFYRPISIRHRKIMSGLNLKSGYYPAVTGAFLLCRKNDFNKVNGFYEKYNDGLEDIDLCLRMGLELKKKCFCINYTSLQHAGEADPKPGSKNDIKLINESNENLFKQRMGEKIIQLINSKSGFTNMRRKIAFIDHYFHRKTRSSWFLISLLAKIFDIDLYWDYSPKGGKAPDGKFIRKQGYDSIICWQCISAFETLKELKGERIIGFPMYDNSAREHNSKFMADMEYFSLSSHMHDKLLENNFKSKYLQYFLNPEPFPDSSRDFSSLRGFFWQRRTSVTWDTIRKLLGDTPFSSLNVHLIQDNKEDQFPAIPDKWKGMTINQTSWFNEQSEYYETLLSGNIFFAPRIREGIGIATLEAMAMGMCVVAPDRPTMNEYIKHNVNGLLYDPDNPEPLDFSNAEALGKEARTSIEKGRIDWLDKISEVIADLSKLSKSTVETLLSVKAQTENPELGLPGNVREMNFKPEKETT